MDLLLLFYGASFTDVVAIPFFLLSTYDIGIDSSFGQGQLSCTRIVYFVTKYQLENRSSHTLAFSQRYLVQGKVSTVRILCSTFYIFCVT